jgi:hypothetical protein
MYGSVLPPLSENSNVFIVLCEIKAAPHLNSNIKHIMIGVTVQPCSVAERRDLS